MEKSVVRGLILATALYANSAFSEFDDAKYISMVYSQAAFLEQCVSRRIIAPTEVHNWNINNLRSLGFDVIEHFSSFQKGSGGEVFDLLRDEWVTASINSVNCKHIMREQEKIKRSFSK